MPCILDKNAIAQCSHGGAAQPIIGNPRVKLSGSEVLTTGTQFSVSACPNIVGTANVPCILGMFASGATRVKVMGMPVLLDSSQATNLPTGATLVITNPQQRVKGQ